jgi:hypothetical protein
MWKIVKLFPDPELMCKKWDIRPMEGKVYSLQQKGKSIGVKHSTNGRIQISYFDNNGKFHQLKRSHIIYYFHHKNMPIFKQEVVDHWDKVRDNDVITNLHAKTPSENRDNTDKRKGCSSKYKGVCLDKRTGMWMTKVRMNNQTYHCKRYHNEKQAAMAYDIIYYKLKKTVLGMNFPELLNEYLEKINKQKGDV